MNGDGGGGKKKKKKKKKGVKKQDQTAQQPEEERAYEDEFEDGEADAGIDNEEPVDEAAQAEISKLKEWKAQKKADYLKWKTEVKEAEVMDKAAKEALVRSLASDTPQEEEAAQEPVWRNHLLAGTASWLQNQPEQPEEGDGDAPEEGGGYGPLVDIFPSSTNETHLRSRPTRPWPRRSRPALPAPPASVCTTTRRASPASGPSSPSV
jgi:hypothetical protein